MKATVNSLTLTDITTGVVSKHVIAIKYKSNADCDIAIATLCAFKYRVTKIMSNNLVTPFIDLVENKGTQFSLN